MLRRVVWCTVTDVSEMVTVPIIKAIGTSCSNPSKFLTGVLNFCAISVGRLLWTADAKKHFEKVATQHGYNMSLIHTFLWQSP
jgi:hypothetical protein